MTHLIYKLPLYIFVSCQVTFSMIEIYNEVARDLLSKKTDRKGLPLHEKPGRGFHSKKENNIEIY